MQTVTDLGEIGAVGGIMRPLDLTLQRNGATWVLTGYLSAELRVWHMLTGTVLALTGETSIEDADEGGVRYTPGAADPIQAASGVYEARVWCQPADGGPPEPSALFRWSIGAGPGPST